MKSYYEFLKHELENYEGDFDKFILYIPEFFKLLCDLLEENISKEDRQKINSALAYFVIPHDIIPEDIYGPMGYVDDIFVCATVLKGLIERCGIDILKKHWNYDEDLNKVIEVSYEKSLKILQEKKLVGQVLENTGLK